MKATTYNVGMFVEHPSRPQWGPGKVMAVSSKRVYVVFRNDIERKAKAILRDLVELTVATDQTDLVLDLLPAAIEEGGDWILPKNYERFLQPKAPRTTATKRTTAADAAEAAEARSRRPGAHV